MEFTDYHLDPCQIALPWPCLPSHLKDNHVRVNAVPGPLSGGTYQELFTMKNILTVHG